jgi:FkbM family methyltransferase
VSFFYKTRIIIHRLLKRFKATRFHKKFINREDLVFDIGANEGNRTAIYLRLGAHVVAVEPQAACEIRLRKRFSSNSGFTLIRKAVSDVSGEADLFISNQSEVSTLSAAYRNHYNDRKEIFYNAVEKVELITLEELIKQFGTPDYIKIDAETFEWNILKTLAIPVKMVSFEYYKPFDEVALMCVDFMHSRFHCEFNFMRLEDMQFELPQWLDHSSFLHFISTLTDHRASGEIFARRKPEKSKTF